MWLLLFAGGAEEMSNSEFVRIERRGNGPSYVVYLFLNMVTSSGGESRSNWSFHRSFCCLLCRALFLCPFFS